MIPKLSIDTSQQAASRLVPDDSATLAKWIETNVVGTLEERMEILRESLLSLHQSKLDPNRYLACLTIYSHPAQAITSEVREHNIGLSLPMPKGGVQLIHGLSEINVQLSNGFKAIILDEADTPTPVLANEGIAASCYGAMHYISRILQSAYEGYQPYPSGLWYEIHQLYVYAKSEEVHEEPVSCLSRFNNHKDTIESLYKRVLLLNLADPYQLPFRAVDDVQLSLLRWGDQAIIQPEPSDPKQRCMFLVDLEFDKPGIPFLSRTRITGDGQFYILNTAELVSTLNSRIDGLLTTRNESWSNPDRVKDGLDAVELLRTLILKWGVQPMRTNDRVATRKPCDVVSGINYVNLMVNDQVPYIADTEAQTMTAMLQQSQNAGAPAKDAQALPVSPIDQPRAQSWFVVDESDAGMQLALDEATGVQVGVGELIGIRVRGEDDIGWVVGVVRWAKNTSTGEARIGVLKLGWPAMPAMVRSEHDGAASVEHTTALLLPGNQELGRGQTLVTPKGMFSPGGTLTIQTADREILVEARTLIISTRAGDCFEFDIV